MSAETKTYFCLALLLGMFVVSVKTADRVLTQSLRSATKNADLVIQAPPITVAQQKRRFETLASRTIGNDRRPVATAEQPPVGDSRR